MDTSAYINPANEAIADKRRGRVVDVAELSRYTGYSVSAIETEIKRGAPLQRRGGPGREHKLDTAQFITWLIRKERERMIGIFQQLRAESLGEGSEFGGSEPESGNYKQRRFAAQAELSEIELAEKRGELVPIEKVMTIFTNLVGIARAQLLVIPTKASPQLAAMKDPKAVYIFLKDVIYDALNELADIDPADLIAQDGSVQVEAAAETDG
jgi:terminase small subunit / prophage DNA-packing protein